MSLLKLPNELLQEVYLQLHSDGKRSQAALNLRLVNKQLRDATAPAFFRRIDATNAKIRCFSLLASGPYADHVLHISAGFRGGCKNEVVSERGDPSQSNFAGSVAKSLPRFPRLKSIKFYNEPPSSTPRSKEEMLAQDMASGLSDTCLPVLETLALTISVAHDFQYFVGPEIQALLSRLRHLRLSSTGSFERYLGPEYLFISQRDTYADVSRLVQGAGELRSLSVNAGQSEFFLRIIAFPPAESLSRLSLEHVHILGPSVNDLIQRSQRRLAVVHFKTCQLIAEEPESWRDIFDSLAECGNLLDLRFEKGSYFVEDGAVPDLDDEEDWDLVLPRDELSDSDIDALGELWGLVDKRRCDLGLDPLPGSDFLADLMTDVDGESAVAG